MVLVVGFYVRLYVHFLGLYVYLKIVGVKNIRFGEPVEPFQILTKYNQNMPVHLELGAAVAGQCFNIVLFVCFMVVNYFWRKIFGRLPDMMSKWMMGYGVGVVLDGVLVFVSACFVLLCIMCGVVVLCTVPLYTYLHCAERMNVQYWLSMYFGEYTSMSTDGVLFLPLLLVLLLLLLLLLPPPLLLRRRLQMSSGGGRGPRQLQLQHVEFVRGVVHEQQLPLHDGGRLQTAGKVCPVGRVQCPRLDFDRGGERGLVCGGGLVVLQLFAPATL